MGQYPSDESIERMTEAGPSSDLISNNAFTKLRRACRKGKGCPHVIRTCRSSGTTAWKPDPANIEIARAVFVASLEFNTHNGDADEWLENLRALCGDRWSPDARQLALLRQLGIIDKLPRMTQDEIDDINKGDVFVKFLAVAQISWLCIQLITRVSRQLPTTQLEIVTL
jgi:hypothetical protein